MMVHQPRTLRSRVGMNGRTAPATANMDFRQHFNCCNYNYEKRSGRCFA